MYMISNLYCSFIKKIRKARNKQDKKYLNERMTKLDDYLED